MLYYPLNIQRFSASCSISASECDVNTVDNTSYVNLSITVKTSGQTYNQGSGAYVNATLTGQNDTLKIPQTSFTINQNSSKVVYSGKVGPFHHNSDGSLNAISISVSGRVTTNTSISASGSCSMSTIPRKASVSLKVNSYAETTAIITWSSDSRIDKWWYSINNGANWTEYTPYSAGATGFNTQISGLTPGSAHQIKVRVRRQDSQLTSESVAVPITTYNYPYCNNSPNFIIGNSLTLGLYNPLGRSVTITLIGNDGTKYGSESTTGTSISGFNSVSYKNWLYGTIPNAPSGKYKVQVVYGSSTKIRDTGNTYNINPTESSPDLVVAKEDINSVTVALTGNKEYLVKGYSNYKLTPTATPKFGTTIDYITIGNYRTQNNTPVTINSATERSYSASAIDKRGNGSAMIPVTPAKFIDYVPLTCNVKVARPLQTGSTVEIEFSGNYFNGNFGKVDNTLTMSWNYRKKGASSWTTGGNITPKISGNTYSGTVNCGSSFDYQTDYEFIVYYQDKLINTSVIKSLSKGVGEFEIYNGALLARGTVLFYDDEMYKTADGINFSKL